MKKYIAVLILFLSSFVLIACGDEDGDSETSAEEAEDEQVAIPEEVIQNAESDPIELKDQMGLELGETGYVVTQSDPVPLEITLHGVEKTQDIGSESENADGDDFYLVGELTVKNLGDTSITVNRPDVVPASDEQAVVNDELANKGDLLGLGTWALNEDGHISSEEFKTNTLQLKGGEETNHKVALSMRGSSDEYLIFYGFYANNNRDFRNKLGWTIPAEQIAKK